MIIVLFQCIFYVGTIQVFYQLDLRKKKTKPSILLSLSVCHDLQLFFNP
jgi:hypothetical protein